MIKLLGEEYEDTKYKYETIKAINSEPTVEAIPIEWLREEARKQLDYGEGVERIIAKWMKENG